MDCELRTNADGNFDADSWIHAVGVGFGRPGKVAEDLLPAHREQVADSRVRGFFQGDRGVATLRSFDQRLTVPGHRDVAAHAVTAVTVQAPYRRRGLLRRMLTGDLAQAKEDGQFLSTLISMEYPIYGAFGYGPAGTVTTRSVRSRASGVPRGWTLPASQGTLDFADGAEVRRLGPELHERFRLHHPGAVDRDARWWRSFTGDQHFFPGWTEPFHVLHRDATGTVQGLVTYQVDHDWADGMPNGTVTVRSLTATSVESERALWHFLLTLDMTTSVDSGRLYPDALLPDLLPDPRAAVVTSEHDFLWVRPLDVPGMLQSRGYSAEGELVLEVTDPLGLADGRFLLTAGPDGASCGPTTRGADLTLDVRALGTLYLGDRPASRLAALGRIDEETPGAVARADQLLSGSRRVWTPDLF